MHRHTYQGQTLEHEHNFDGQEHGYYGHPEDAGSPDYGAGTYELLSPSTDTLLDRVTGFLEDQLSRDDMSLAEIAGEVLTMVTRDGTPPAGKISPAAAGLARVEGCIADDGGDRWADAEALGARDSLRRVVAAEQARS